MSSTPPVRQVSGMQASADLSAKKFHIMKVSGDRTVTFATAASDQPIGILQNDPTSGNQAEVAGNGGGAFLELGGTVTAGALLTASAAGAGIASTTAGDKVVATALEGGVIGDQIAVEVTIHDNHA